MSIYSKTLMMSALAAGLVAGVAMASPGEYEREAYYQGRGPMPFEAFDLNGDGVVTAEEHARVRSERMGARAEQGYPMRNAGTAPSFDQIDVDGDGSISRDELSRAQAQHRPVRGMGPWNR